MVGASIANVIQARPEVRAIPLFTLLAWSMGLRALIDALVALALTGPPVFDRRPAIGSACSISRWPRRS